MKPNLENINDGDKFFVFAVVRFSSIIIRIPFIPTKLEYTNNNQCRLTISIQYVFDRRKKHDNDMIMSTTDVVIIVTLNSVCFSYGF